MINDPEVQVDYRPFPRSFQDLGLPEIFLANLLLKHAFFMDVFYLADLTERLKLSHNIVTSLLDYLHQEKFVVILGPDPLKPAPSTFTMTHRYGLSEAGKKRAAQLLDYDGYVGPAPVTLEDYWQQVERQTASRIPVTSARLQRALAELVLPSTMLAQLGPVVISSRTLFLYGPPGNGKTTVGLKLGQVWDDAILVPYAIFVEGSVIRIFDQITHQVQEGAPPGQGSSDPRWVRCRRPVVLVGGELTLSLLDLSFNPVYKYYEAPLQLKANNGTLMVDDFGRQKISPEELLNRWIIPLENRKDFLCLHTGQKFAIPFDQFIIFATNLDPHTLVDEAFFRRVRSKVKVDYVNRDQFMEIFRRVCQKNQIEYDQEAIDYLLAKYYDGGQRPLTACHPRDLVEQIISYSRFNQFEPKLTRENLDWACQIYFVS
jgi:hypothetical protein